MMIHIVSLDVIDAERFMAEHVLLFQKAETIDESRCQIATEDQDSDALVDALDDNGIMWSRYPESGEDGNR